MNPWDGVAKFFTGLINDGKMRDLYRLILGCVGSGVVTFMVTFGVTTLSLLGLGQVAGVQNAGFVVSPILALVAGMALGSVHAGVIIYKVLRDSPAAKGVPLAAPMSVIKQLDKALQEGIEIKPPNTKGN